MQEGIARTIGKLDETEAFVRIVPVDAGPQPPARRGCRTVDLAAMHIRNCGSAVDGCHRRHHGDGMDENLCLYCSRDFLGSVERCSI
jgi:hypothetical protein